MKTIYTLLTSIKCFIGMIAVSIISDEVRMDMTSQAFKAHYYGIIVFMMRDEESIH